MKRKAGRPQHKPTEKQRGKVEGLALAGSPQLEIARIVGMSIMTLRKHYMYELETAKAERIGEIARTVYERAKDGEPWACCFVLKTQAGWREKSAIVHENADGSPIAFTLTIDSDDRSHS